MRFLIKTTIFIIIIIAVELFISVIFRYTTLFNKYLTIPQDFMLETPNFRTIFTNALLFGFVVFLIVSYKKVLNIKRFNFEKNQIVFMFLSAFFLFLQYFFKYLINRNTDFFIHATIFWGTIKILINILFGISVGLAVYGISFTKYFVKNFRRDIVLFFIVSIAFFFLMLLVQNLWTYFSGAISEILYRIFSLFFSNVTYQPYVTSFTMAEKGGPILGIGNFQAVIGQPCSGIDSFLLFTSLYTLIFILDYKRLRKSLTIAMFFIGVIGMFLTNALRIFLLFLVGAFIDAKFAIGMFHSNIGWILFILYFFIFWWITSRYVYKDETTKNK